MAEIIFVNNYSYVEPFSQNQVHQTCKKYQQIKKAVAMPDLHPGKGIPVGCAFLSEAACFPALIGPDIGCGMTLFNIKNSNVNRFNMKRATKKLEELTLGPSDSGSKLLEQNGLNPTAYDDDLGTIGGGNHFAEFQEIHEIKDPEAFGRLGLDELSLLLLVHSGSRSYGHSIYSKLKKDVLVGDEATNYLLDHDDAVKWATANRMYIASRLCDKLNLMPTKLINIIHNYLQKDGDKFIHRKGVGYVLPDQLSIIPGSRGAFSYIVKMTPDVELAEHHLHCIAHGAGRRLNRGMAESKFSEKYSKDALKRTKLGSNVVCKNNSLLYQEAPDAYKNIDDVIADLIDSGLITIVAILKPIITFKS